MSKILRASIVIGVGLGWLTSAASGGTWAPTMELGGTIWSGWSIDWGSTQLQTLFSPIYMATVGEGTYSASIAGAGPGPHYGWLDVTYPAANSDSTSSPIVIHSYYDVKNLDTTYGSGIAFNVNMIADLNEPGSDVHYYVEWERSYTQVEGGQAAGSTVFKFETDVQHNPWYGETFEPGTVSGSFAGMTTNGILKYDGIGADIYVGQGHAAHGILEVTYRIYADTVPIPTPGAAVAMLAGLGIAGTRRRR